MIKEPSSVASFGTLLKHPKYELIPMKNVEACFEHIPADAKLSITVSPSKGIDATLQLCKTVSAYLTKPKQITPHISARLVKSQEDLKAILETVKAIGIQELFIVGGDASSPVGPYKDSFDLVQAIRDLDDQIRLGITAYPEGHPNIPKDILLADLKRKAPYAQFMASQLCFEADTLKNWLKQTRLAGITLPLQIGVAGVVDLAKLMSISTRIGVGDSIRYFTKHTGNVLKLMGGYKPGDLLDKLVPIYADPYFNIEAFHIYTFNNLQKTEAWRKQKLKTLGMS